MVLAVPWQTTFGIHPGFPKLGSLFGGPHIKDYSISGSMLASAYLGKLPYRVVFLYNPKGIYGVIYRYMRQYRFIWIM